MSRKGEEPIRVREKTIPEYPFIIGSELTNIMIFDDEVFLNCGRTLEETEEIINGGSYSTLCFVYDDLWYNLDKQVVIIAEEMECESYYVILAIRQESGIVVSRCNNSDKIMFNEFMIQFGMGDCCKFIGFNEEFIGVFYFPDNDEQQCLTFKRNNSIAVENYLPIRYNILLGD